MAGDLTPAQWAAAMLSDTYGLGFAPFVAVNDYLNCQGRMNWICDGVTPYPNGGTLGPSGAITGATNATPIVITSTAHGLSTGDNVVIAGVGGNTAANNAPFGTPPTAEAWTITKVNANSFSLNNSVGNGAYTSGGTWNWCVYGQPDLNVTTGDVLGAIRIADVVGHGSASAATGDQMCKLTMLAAIVNQYGGQIPLVNSSGAENNVATSLKQAVGGAGTNSYIALSNLELRFGSLAEKLTGLIGNPIGAVATVTDIQNAIATGQA